MDLRTPRGCVSAIAILKPFAVWSCRCRTVTRRSGLDRRAQLVYTKEDDEALGRSWGAKVRTQIASPINRTLAAGAVISMLVMMAALPHASAQNQVCHPDPGDLFITYQP